MNLVYNKDCFDNDHDGYNDDGKADRDDNDHKDVDDEDDSKSDGDEDDHGGDDNMVMKKGIK